MPKAKVLQNIPAGETVYETVLPDGKNVYLITSGAGRTEYRLYQKTDSGFVPVGRNASPALLEEKYIVYGPESDTEPETYADDTAVTPFEMQEHENRRLGVRPDPPVSGEDKTEAKDDGGEK